jgi:hypothetical protein
LIRDQERATVALDHRPLVGLTRSASGHLYQRPLADFAAKSRIQMYRRIDGAGAPIAPILRFRRPMSQWINC